MKVVDEETFSSFLSDYAKCPKIEEALPISIEVMELFANAPHLVEKAMNLGITFQFKQIIFKNLKGYFNLPNFDRTSFMVEPVSFYHNVITDYETRKDLEKIEKIESKPVADFFLKQEQMEPKDLTECDYFEWRLVFSHWIKGDQKERIREIISPAIIKMLRLEFPLEMKKILPETSLP